MKIYLDPNWYFWNRTFHVDYGSPSMENLADISEFKFLIGSKSVQEFNFSFVLITFYSLKHI